MIHHGPVAALAKLGSSLLKGIWNVIHTGPTVSANREGLNTDTFVVETENKNNRGSVIENEIGPGWKIALDNLDIFQRVREMTEDNKNKDHHWINHVKVTNRVSGNQFAR